MCAKVFRNQLCWIESLVLTDVPTRRCNDERT
jgi:hypothetical protein